MQNDKDGIEPIEIPDVADAPVADAPDDAVEVPVSVEDEDLNALDRIPAYIVIRKDAKNTIVKSDRMHTPNTVNSQPIAFLPGSLGTLSAVMDQLEALKISITATEADKWSAACSDGAQAHVYEDALNEAARRSGAEWKHIVEYGGVPIAPQMRKPGMLSGGTVGGPAAISRVAALTRGGSILRFPVWGSGFHIEIQNSSLAKDIELDARISMDRAYLGRKTRGRIFTMDTYAITRKLVNFIYDNIIDTSMGVITIDQFLSLVKLPSLSVLAMAQAHVNYPKGYPYIRPCTANPEKCTHTVEETINVIKLNWVDGTRFDAAALAHMSKEYRRHKPEDVVKYQEALYSEKGYVRISDNVSLRLMVPSLLQHLETSERWINELSRAAISAFGDTIDETQRSNYMDLQFEANLLRNYSCWVESVVITELDEANNEVVSTVNDRDNIEAILMDWSSQEDVMGVVLDAIEVYQNQSIVELTAIPNFECPKCGAFQETNEGPFSSLIPIDGVATFFLMQQSYLTTKTGSAPT